jgi:hypothetical protein
MNVYQEEYTEQFIKELPVDFHKIRKMDLSKIDSSLHCLFTTDWNWGKHSKMNFVMRNHMNELWLANNFDEITTHG